MKRLLVAAGLAVAAAVTVSSIGSSSPITGAQQKFSKVNHIVVIYEENHSFDNLYGGWEGTNGRQNATNATQVDQSGAALGCLKQLDVNLVAQGGACWPNSLFDIDQYIPPTATTCPPDGVFASNGVLDGTGLAGGCTRDIVHRFYQEQYQLDGGKQDRYAVGSDAGGLTMGYYDTTQLPIYKYLHANGHPHYAILDDFFQGAFGGSFLNHQFLIAAAAPVDTSAAHAGNHSQLDSAGFPNAGYPMYHPLPGAVYNDSFLTQKCGLATTVTTLACGDYAVNTMQPTYQPTAGGSSVLPPQTGRTIGDELTAAGVDWAWYAGGWDDAAGIETGPGWTNGPGPTCGNPNSKPNPSYPFCPNKNFQYHHQPFNYYAAFDPNTAAGAANRAAHLLDEQDFVNAATSSTGTCNLKPVSFIKPIGDENEHPGYASEANGSSHLVDLLKTIESSACASDTMIVVTYDEFGGQYDHVPPPGAGSATDGPHDLFGPGTRIPALVLAPNLRGTYSVDSTEHDTTSILATIEHRWNLPPLGAETRDGKVNDLSTVYDARPVN